MKPNTQYCPYCMTPVEDGQLCPRCGLTAGNYIPQPHHLRPGTLLMDRYLVGRVLGEGGFGITYIGCDLRLELKVAIKEYYPVDKVSRNTAVSEQLVSFSISPARNGFERGKIKFLEEARTMAKMDKQQVIVGVRDYFEANNTAYIVMEYIEGTTFTELVSQRGGRIPPRELFSMIEPLFGALETLHKTGLIHRDISPDNLMLEDGEVRLIDFGCARETDHGDETLTITLKHGYAPIEQYQQNGQGPWTDVYSLCATIYFCLVGQKPPQALNRIGSEKALLLPSKLGVDISPKQEKAILHGLNLSPRNRFQTIAELHTALLDFTPKPDPYPFIKVLIAFIRRHALAGSAGLLALVLLILAVKILPEALSTSGDPDSSVQPVVNSLVTAEKESSSDDSTSEQTDEPGIDWASGYRLTAGDITPEGLQQLMDDPSVTALVLPDGVSGQIGYLEDGSRFTLTKPLLVEEGAGLDIDAMCVDGDGIIEGQGSLMPEDCDLRLKGSQKRLSFPEGIDGHCSCQRGFIWLEDAMNINIISQSSIRSGGGYVLTFREDIDAATEVTTLQELIDYSNAVMPDGIKITRDITLDRELSFSFPVYICEGVTLSSTDNQNHNLIMDNSRSILVNYGTCAGEIYMDGGAAFFNYGRFEGLDDQASSVWMNENSHSVILNEGYILYGNAARLWQDNHLLNTPAGTLEADNFYLLNASLANYGIIEVTGKFEALMLDTGSRLDNFGAISITGSSEMFSNGYLRNLGSLEVEADGKLWNGYLIENDGGSIHAASGAQLLGTPGGENPANGGYLTTGGTVELLCSRSPAVHSIAGRAAIDEIAASAAEASTAEQLDQLLSDSSVQTIAIPGEMAYSGELKVSKDLYITGSLTVTEGSLVAVGSRVFLEDGGSLTADNISLLDGAVVQLDDSTLTVPQGGLLDLDGSVILGSGDSRIFAESADIQLRNESLIAPESDCGAEFFSADNSHLTIVGKSAVLMPSCSDMAVLSGLSVEIDGARFSAGNSMMLRNCTLDIQKNGTFAQYGTDFSFENCTVTIAEGAVMRSDYCNMLLRDTTITNDGDLFLGGWQEFQLTLQDSVIYNNGNSDLYIANTFTGESMIYNYGTLNTAIDRLINPYRIEGNPQISEW